jgi:hypothetical protein
MSVKHIFLYLSSDQYLASAWHCDHNDQDNYLVLWRAQALTALYNYDLYSFVGGTTTTPPKKIPTTEGVYWGENETYYFQPTDRRQDDNGLDRIVDGYNHEYM